MKYLIKIQYRGKDFSGYQRQKQKNLRTVQDEVEKALSKMLQEKIEIFSSSRTDAGVNAYALPAHFLTNGLIPPNKLPMAVNQILPDDVKIVSCQMVDENFNARHNVKNKIYEYNLYINHNKLPLIDETSFQLKTMPSIFKMKRCVKLLVGEHNFKAFSSSNGNSNSYVKKIFWIKIKRSKNQIKILVCGNSFLYNMVRIIVGTLLQYGYGKLNRANIIDALKNQNRNSAGFVAPAKALFLKEVKY